MQVVKNVKCPHCNNVMKKRMVTGIVPPDNNMYVQKSTVDIIPIYECKKCSFIL